MQRLDGCKDLPLLLHQVFNRQCLVRNYMRTGILKLETEIHSYQARTSILTDIDRLSPNTHCYCQASNVDKLSISGQKL